MTKRFQKGTPSQSEVDAERLGWEDAYAGRREQHRSWSDNVTRQAYDRGYQNGMDARDAECARQERSMG